MYEGFKHVFRTPDKCKCLSDLDLDKFISAPKANRILVLLFGVIDKKS